MATHTYVADDLTGETLPEDTPSTTLRINDPRGDVAVRLDLSDTSFKGLLKAIQKYVDKGSPIATLSQKVTDDTDRQFAQRARQWAIATNLQPTVSERGAVPQRALDAYREHLAQQEGHASAEAIEAALTAGENVSKSK